ncbi:MAG: ABC transporter ATP-binding protein [Halanaerobiales bacterium]
MKENNTILEVNGLKKYFPIKKGVFRRVVGHVKAVDDVDFFIREGETLGLVGESGCGKSTTGRCLIKLMDPTAGEIKFKQDGQFKDIISVEKDELKEIRKDIQIVFQDPFSSLDSRMSVRDIIAEPLKVNKIGNRKERTERVEELLERVGLNSYQMNRYPHEFSGGQRQRIGVARALALNPRLIICDEPVSALDVSVQAQVLNLFEDLQDEFGFTYLFIAHDLSVIEHISDRVMVMYLGKMVEISDSESIYQDPRHPYTEALLGSIPVGDPRSEKERIPLPGNVPDPSNPPPGCNLNTRCPYAKDRCSEEEPELIELPDKEDHYVSCLYAQELDLSGYDELTKTEEVS